MVTLHKIEPDNREYLEFVRRLEHFIRILKYLPVGKTLQNERKTMQKTAVEARLIVPTIVVVVLEHTIFYLPL